MLERFTDRARRVVVLAQEHARMLRHNYVGSEHLLLALIDEREGIGAKALDSQGVTVNGALDQVEAFIGQGPKAPAGHIPFTPRTKKIFDLALRESLQLGHSYIGTEHLLLGLLREGEGIAAQILAKGMGVDLNILRKAVIELITAPTQPLAPRTETGLAERACGLHLIVLRVSDLDRSYAFYSTLGLPLVDETRADGSMRFTAALTDEIALELRPAGALPPTRNVQMRFVVNDLAETLGRLDELGYGVTGTGGVPATAIVQDPDGNTAVLVPAFGVAA